MGGERFDSIAGNTSLGFVDARLVPGTVPHERYPIHCVDASDRFCVHGGRYSTSAVYHYVGIVPRFIGCSVAEGEKDSRCGTDVGVEYVRLSSRWRSNCDRRRCKRGKMHTCVQASDCAGNSCLRLPSLHCQSSPLIKKSMIVHKDVPG